MKTTIEISDPLFEQARRLADKTGSTFREIVENALRQFLKQGRKSPPEIKLCKYSFRGRGVAKGLSEGDWARIRELSYGVRGG